MELSDMKIRQRVWFEYPNDKLFGFGIISKVGHRVRIDFEQRGMHGKSIFAYSASVYPEEAFEWCEDCDGDGWTNYSCCGYDMRGMDIDLCPGCHEHWSTDEQETCEGCGGKGVLTKTKTIKL